MKSVKEIEILESGLSKKLVESCNKLMNETGEIDKQSIDYVFNKAYMDLEDMLLNDHRYSQSEVEQILYDVFDDTKNELYRISNNGREQELEEKFSSINNVSKKAVGKFLELDELSEEKDVNKLSDEISYNTKDIAEDDAQSNLSTYRLLEDEISLEMKQRIKEKLRVYDDPRGEEAYFEVSQYIDRRLRDEVIDKYQEGSQQLGISIQQDVDNILDEVKQEYKMEIAKEEQGKEENAKDKLGLTDLVNSPEEAFESSKQREEAKEHEIDDKNKDGLITHVID